MMAWPRSESGRPGRRTRDEVFSSIPPVRDFFYYIAYRHANGWGAANPFRTPRRLDTAQAMTFAREDIGRSIDRDPASIVIVTVIPLEGERWISDEHREAEARLNDALRSAGI